jgi:hypothetical protein
MRERCVVRGGFGKAAKPCATVLEYGVRFFGEKLSIDLAFLNLANHAVFPGLPFVSFAVGF